MDQKDGHEAGGEAEPSRGQRSVGWSEAVWLNPPPKVEQDGADLVVTTGNRTDFWRTTAHGYVTDNGHALLAPLPDGSAIEVTFDAVFERQFDQAGIMVRTDETSWLKAGLEFVDGSPQLGAVVTRGVSDWSTGLMPEWNGRAVTLRASRSGDALTVRARCEDGPWRTVRLAPLDPGAATSAGPYCCTPEREGLRIRFTRCTIGPADSAVHES